MKNSGGYKVRNGKIYVFGTIDKVRYRFSTGKEATKENLRWVAKNYWSVLLNLIDEKKAPKQSLKLSDFLLEVIELSAHKRSKSTQSEYISKAKRLIIPYFKAYELKDIKPFDIEQWQSEILKRYSTTTAKRLKCILNMALNKAYLNDIIPKNPLNLVDNFKVKHEKREPYTIDEMLKILHFCDGWFGLFLHLAFTTGLRTGELIALKKSDIDFNKRIIYVKRSITRGEIKESSDTKNHNRIVVLADYLVDELKAHDSGSEWLFVSRRNKPFFESKVITKNYFKPLLERIGVKYKTLYATRHTFISLLRNAGVSRDFVAELAGHSEAISDKHYYKSLLNEQKVKAINNVFCELKLNNKTQIKAQ